MLSNLTPDQLLSSPDVSKWFKQALRDALQRDPVDAANEAELLAHVLISVAKNNLERAVVAARHVGAGHAER